MSVTLSVSEREEIMKLLNDEQKSYLNERLKRGRKTVFANTLAMDKGLYLPDGASDEEIELLLDEWILEDYIDHEVVSADHPCECGRPLRYEYIVRHLQTNERRSFGVNHFEEHTGLSPDIVKAIMKGFQKIDYELDEVLSKLKNNWTRDDTIQDLPHELEMPHDILQHLHLKLPLLERQKERLNKILSDYQDNTFYNDNFKHEENQTQPTQVNEFDHIHNPASDYTQAKLSLFDDQPVQNPSDEEIILDAAAYILSNEYKDAILSYLDEGVESARLICELLIKNQNAPRERYISNKPRIYYSVCLFLDNLIISEQLELHSHDTIDRIYK
ncbi:DUF3895 domain-containing protein [Alkalihalobacillus sp. AL-G]|uniref:DUF3895 domain-containing protein n=1 Tax=Alkalihalobacillus sp. AL-G TaxID=2926399 RepID=UPI00272B9925|nr:DUF3895 domain-containing protein [Alkalihalobacillus sp. AL-G]WLD91921.1 DUF3895 domain-containing protein [Alkalihalobacillus sp. AL-G]